MARRDERHPATVEGDWFVDSRCIDCDASRHVAPGLIARNPSDGNSVFVRQPSTLDEIDMAWRAALVCPTRSVGHVTQRKPPSPVFPHDLGDGVFRLGHNSERSFGAHSYLVARPAGNVMIDAPRWTREVYEPLAARGGVAHVLLSHRDDVADAERYAEHFGARVWIHADDGAAAPFATDVVEGAEAVSINGATLAFPVPGHTKGSMLFLIDGHLLFSGDSLAWDPERERLTAFRDACWYSWPAQQASLRRFAASGLRFNRLFCGHGWSHDLDADRFHEHLVALTDRM